MTLLDFIILKIKKRFSDFFTNSPIGYRFAKGAFWSFTGSLLSRGLQLISFIIIARILGKVTFGELGIIQSTVATFGVFAGFGLGVTCTKFIAEYKIKDKMKAGRIVALTNTFAIVTSIFMGLVLIISAPWLAKYILGAQRLSILLQISSILLIGTTINGVQLGLLSGMEAFKTSSKINGIYGGLYLLILTIGSHFWGIIGTIWALNATIIFICIVSNFYVRKCLNDFAIRPLYKDCLIEKKIIWDFSIPVFLAGVITGPVTWICHSILVNQRNGYGEMGLFNAANQWFAVILFIPNIVGNALLPILSEKISLHNKKDSTTLLKYSLIINSVIISPLIIAGIFFSGEIMKIYGKGFESGSLTLVYTLITAFFYTLQASISNVIIASGKMWIGFGLNLLWGIVFIFTFLTATEKTANYLAYARTLAYAFHLILTFLLVTYIFKKQLL